MIEDFLHITEADIIKEIENSPMVYDGYDEEGQMVIVGTDKERKQLYERLEQLDAMKDNALSEQYEIESDIS